MDNTLRAEEHVNTLTLKAELEYLLSCNVRSPSLFSHIVYGPLFCAVMLHHVSSFQTFHCSAKVFTLYNENVLQLQMGYLCVTVYCP